MATPKLRFKEFDGDWSLKSINDIASKVGSGSTPRGGAAAYVDKGIIFIRSQNVNDNQLLLDDVVFIPESIHEKMSGSEVLPNDILLNITGASIGRSCVVPDTFSEGNVNQHVCIIRTPNENPIFVQSFLSSEKGQNHIQSKQVGGGREGLNFQAIRSIDFEMPLKEEQTKIASFLSAVDEKISQLTQKHELFNQYKQGMMQKLFSRQIRFKADDGSEFGEWERTTLGEKGTFLKGKGISKADIIEGGILPCIRYGELYTYYGEIISNVISATNLDRDTLVLSKANDVLIPGSGETQIDIATASCVLDDDIALSGDLNIYRTKENGIFISYMIRSSLKMQIAQLAQGNSVVHLYSSQLKGVQLSLPCLGEQTKIANFLSAIDQKIEVVIQQIEQAKQWKKGLLQQMFV
ncbi:type I restriction modification DNA specificity domain protein [Acinetobacter radioresistens WC-A-157]|uniref:restriction endonuclease subunit S n=1 Tax=Acinetobacter radioresistens TaxID=40216 RepID=UPI000277C4B4|nr:restriction endonuclease subunit S [Acinetobacter radioresistens]EJO34022.1 type I restriction modification DNA specificity domain protein [Acinetobacter radioresistens WC-A-157]